LSPPTCYQPATPPLQLVYSSSPITSYSTTSYLSTSPSSSSSSSGRSFGSSGLSFSSPDHLSYSHHSQSDTTDTPNGLSFAQSPQRSFADSSLSCLGYRGPGPVHLPALAGQLTARVPASPTSSPWQYNVRDNIYVL
jgi:hypothetical protein